jgi:hypothetical protein
MKGSHSSDETGFNCQVAMIDFEQVLQRVAAPRLELQGYPYNDQLRLAGELFGFSKLLADGVHGIAQFQRHTDVNQADFTVNLLRVKADELVPRVYGGYATSRGARLSHVMWFVNKVHTYPEVDHWWQARTAAELESALYDAVDQLERYGLPWLEDPHGAKPWEMPIYRGREFVEAVETQVVPALQLDGFDFKTQLLPGGVPYPYFVKLLSPGEFALAEFQSVYSLDPGHFLFDVRLQRKSTPDPLDFGGHYREWRSVSLAQLVWRHTQPDSEELTIDTIKSMLWQYADRHELAVQLGDALEKFTRIGFPWLDVTNRQ